MTPELQDDRSLVLQLHGLLAEIDPVRWRDDAATALTARLRELQRRFEERSGFASLAASLGTQLQALEQPAANPRARWLAFKQRLAPVYEAKAAQLRAEKVHMPSLRPTNWARSAMHLTSAAVAIAVIEGLWAHPRAVIAIAVAWAAAGWAMELGRRSSPRINALLMRLFGPVAHAHETHRINSATWYATALVLLALLQMPAVSAIAVGILGVGDPLAGLVGRRFGRTTLVNGRSLEGTATFFLSGALVAFGLLRVFHASLGVGPALAIAALAALLGALAELFSRRLDDNFSVPVSAAAGAALALALLA